jgi:E3 ubiquitin-protein ligase BRE1
MLEYRRSYETETRKVRELEEQQRRLEASVQAVEVCWTQVCRSSPHGGMRLTLQLVNAVRSIVPDTGSSEKGALDRELIRNPGLSGRFKLTNQPYSNRH